MDYAHLIDRETRDFINRTADYYPADAVDLSIAEQRRLYDNMCRAFFQGYPDGVRVENRNANGVPVRVYETGSTRVNVLYFHGGGFVVGGLESHDDVCAEICARTGYRVISVDYRLAPEHKHPAHFEDSWTAFEYVTLTWPDPVILSGDSAGGNLAAAVAHQARGKPGNILGQVLIYPGLGGDSDKGSYLAHAAAPMLSREETLFYKKIRVDGEVPLNDPTFSPLQDTDFSGLPPSVIITAECDPLSDDGRDYRDRILAAGGRAYWHNEAGLVHGYLRGRNTVTRARESFDRIVGAIAVLGQGNWVW